MDIYNFLYITRKYNPNLKSDELKNNIEVYYKNAINFFYSIKKEDYNINYFLLTNNKNYLTKNFNQPQNFKIINIPFHTKVPKNINFYSTHFKIDVFHYLSKKKNYSFLIDLDTVCININKIKIMKNLKSNKIVGLYNRTEETIESYSKEKVKKDLEFLLENKLKNVKWFGGEFISGKPSFFKFMWKNCRKIEKKYFKSKNIFFHNGDEMLTNPILNKKKIKYFDVGKKKIIYRYWNNATNHKQKTFDEIKKYVFLHLPADKKLLSQIPFKYMHDKDFLVYYEKLSQNLFRKIFLFLKKIARKIVKILIF